MGLRLEDALSPKVVDIDAGRKRIHIRRGKGHLISEPLVLYEKTSKSGNFLLFQITSQLCLLAGRIPPS
jgi:hypothetical protein